MDPVPPELSAVVAAFEETGWSMEVLDASWKRVWASRELRLTLRLEPDADVGIGRHGLETRRDIALLASLDEESARSWYAFHAPFVVHDTGVSVEELREIAPHYADLAGSVVAAEPPPRWAFALELEELGRIRGLGERVLAEDGTLLGTAFLYGSALPASLLAFIARGDIGHFQRVTELVDPGRRAGAILFADVEGSTDRSRRLPSARYFELIRGLAMAIDAAILEEGGIVGKHAGDGVSAFFLASQLGSPSSASHAAITSARRIRDAAAALEGDWRVNVGVHWGATLYMGQFATAGRLEVTALGDEVNECARIQETARGGALLASKQLVERLEPADATALGLDPSALAYTLLGELPGAGEKVRRDAASLPVAALP